MLVLHEEFRIPIQLKFKALILCLILQVIISSFALALLMDWV